MTHTYTPEQIAANRAALRARVAARRARELQEERARVALAQRYAARMTRQYEAAQRAVEAAYHVDTRPNVTYAPQRTYAPQPSYVWHAPRYIGMGTRSLSGHATCSVCLAPISIGSVTECDHSGHVSAARVTLTRRSLMCRDARHLVAIVRDVASRERVAALDAQEGRSRYRNTRTAAALARAAAAGLMVDAQPSTRATGTYDPAPWRGITSAREARYSPRGATGIRGIRGAAERVSVRDAHAPTQSDEHGLAATTLLPLLTVGYSTHPALTPEQHAWLLMSVRKTPRAATYTRLMPGPHGRMVTRGVPVTYHSHEHASRVTRERAHAATHATRAERDAALMGAMGAADPTAATA